MNSPVNHAGITVDAVDCFAEQCILTIVEWLRGKILLPYDAHMMYDLPLHEYAYASLPIMPWPSPRIKPTTPVLHR